MTGALEPRGLWSRDGPSEMSQTWPRWFSCPQRPPGVRCGRPGRQDPERGVRETPGPGDARPLGLALSRQAAGVQRLISGRGPLTPRPCPAPSAGPSPPCSASARTAGAWCCRPSTTSASTRSRCSSMPAPPTATAGGSGACTSPRRRTGWTAATRPRPSGEHREPGAGRGGAGREVSAAGRARCGGGGRGGGKRELSSNCDPSDDRVRGQRDRD